MRNIDNRALIVLAAHDYESLDITLRSLSSTVGDSEKVVVILNSKRTYTSEKVERVARVWAAASPATRHVVRPLCAGSEPYHAITEILAGYAVLKDVDYICKIDDDVIPLKAGWVDRLARTYQCLSENHTMGFVTGLINNNNWGFKELVSLFGKTDEYRQIMNYHSKAGAAFERLVGEGDIDSNSYGTIWQHSYLAWWLHQWTSLQPAQFAEKTAALHVKRIEPGIHYSIGCIFFEKDLWLSMRPKKHRSFFDEKLIHLTCLAEKREKYALMSEPMIHLFYNVQRLPNRDIVQPLTEALADYFNDNSFHHITRMRTEDLAIMTEETQQNIKYAVNLLYNKRLSAKWRNFIKRMKAGW